MEAAAAALSLSQPASWIGPERGGRRAAGLSSLAKRSSSLNERRARVVVSRDSKRRGVLNPSGRVELSVSCSCNKSGAFGSESLHEAFDEALILKWKSQEVLRYLNERCIYLVGMMGSGKSTVAKILSEVLGYSYFDSDNLVEQAVGMSSVAEIFKQHSEAFFRDSESEVLSDLSSMRRLVVATGGGAVVRPINWRYMKRGITVWLDVPLEALARRIAAVGTASRPLLHEESGDPYTKAFVRLSTLAEQRGEAYANADARVCLQHMADKKGHEDVCTLTPTDIAIEALLKIESFLTKDAALRERSFLQG